MLFFSGGVYVSPGITSSVCEVVFNVFIELVFGTFCDEIFFILLAILLSVKSPVTSTVFLLAKVCSF